MECIRAGERGGSPYTLCAGLKMRHLLFEGVAFLSGSLHSQLLRAYIVSESQSQ